MHRVLIIDDDEVFVDDLLYHLGERFDWLKLTDGAGAIRTIEETLPDVVLLDIELPGEASGLDILSDIRKEAPRVPVVMVTRHDPADMGAEAWRRGCFGYIAKCAPIEQLAAQIERAIEEAGLYRESEARRQEILERTGRLVGESRAMQGLREEIARVARTDTTVLITGETGTGKELVAREIHERSPRRHRLLLPVNCAALEKSLVASVLFGHEKGAFTGAVRRQPGKFAMADGGTLFLDEIGEVPMDVQGVLLRVLEDKVVYPLGSSKGVPVDVRVIASTNRDLAADSRNGRFREDLYYRLRVVPIHVPPLRERKEDIPLLAQHFLDLLALDMKRKRCRLSSASLTRLLGHHWPGNVRELRHVLQYAFIHSDGDVLEDAVLANLVQPEVRQATYKEARRQAMDAFDRNFIASLIRECDGNLSEVARRMHLSREGLRKMMKRLGIERPDRETDTCSAAE